MLTDVRRPIEARVISFRLSVLFSADNAPGDQLRSGIYDLILAGVLPVVIEPIYELPVVRAETRKPRTLAAIPAKQGG